MVGPSLRCIVSKGKDLGWDLGEREEMEEMPRTSGNDVRPYKTKIGVLKKEHCYQNLGCPLATLLHQPELGGNETLHFFECGGSARIVATCRIQTKKPWRRALNCQSNGVLWTGRGTQQFVCLFFPAAIPSRTHNDDIEGDGTHSHLYDRKKP